jgi:hypothetical protein
LVLRVWRIERQQGCEAAEELGCREFLDSDWRRYERDWPWSAGRFISGNSG